MIYLGDKKNYPKPSSLILNNLELIPYQYREDLGYDKSLTIAARMVMSEKQYAELGKLPNHIEVLRGGIDKEPKEMDLVELAWSKSNNEIKVEIRLFDKEDKASLPCIVWQDNSARLAAEQSLIMDELLEILVSTGILEAEKINEIKSKITRDRVWEKRRELNRLRVDLDEFKSIEEE